MSSAIPWVSPPSVPIGPRTRVLVTGSRAWTDAAVVRTALTEAWRAAGQPLVVVHGGCPTGADAIAAAWVAEHEFAGMAAEVHRADWARHGRAAGPIRNAAMVAAGADVCLAFPAGPSRGTRGCVELAKQAGITVVTTEAVA